MMDDLVLEVKWPAIYFYEVFSEMVKVEYILTYEYGACTYIHTAYYVGIYQIRVYDMYVRVLSRLSCLRYA